jgi:hypothetical protein
MRPPEAMARASGTEFARRRQSESEGRSMRNFLAVPAVLVVAAALLPATASATVRRCNAMADLNEPVSNMRTNMTCGEAEWIADQEYWYGPRLRWVQVSMVDRVHVRFWNQTFRVTWRTVPAADAVMAYTAHGGRYWATFQVS